MSFSLLSLSWESTPTERAVRAEARTLYTLMTTLSSGEAATAGANAVTWLETAGGGISVGSGTPSTLICCSLLLRACRPAAAGACPSSVL